MFKSKVNKNKTRANILLIDDDPIFREVMTAVAKSNDVGLDAVESVKKVSSPAKIKNYDAILLDYDLEDMTGFEIAEYLQKNFPGKPVIMVSSTNRPWQDRLKDLPNLRGFSSKWERPTEILRNIIEVTDEKLQAVG